MSEVIKDSSAFKLFGKTITLSPPPPPPQEILDSDVSLSEHRHSSSASSTSQDTKDESVGDYESTNPSEEKSSSSDTSDDPKKDEISVMKKPDKIVPCPRCSSMDTKFCYFNNYNVNQPRHFCKKCQRYWTSGGTMRNVPVGSGRRKTKNALLPDYHSITVSSDSSDILQTSLESNNWLISHHGFPVSFYPATLYWGSGMARNDNPPPLHQLPVVLGKRPREGRESLDGVLVPKTLRIHDPIEAAKSSIWSTLGIKNDSLGLFKAIESKGDSRRGVGHRAMMLQANPAALSRSVNFHERA